VLILVNSMNSGSSGFLSGGGSNGGANGESGGSRYFLDVNGDSYLSPLDALLVINHLNNRNGSGEGEGEGASLATPASEKDSESSAFQVVEVPFLKKRTSGGVDFAVYGPMLSSKESDEYQSLADYLSSNDSDNSELDYLDGIAADVFRNS